MTADLFAWINARDQTPTAQTVDLQWLATTDEADGEYEITKDIEDGSRFPNRKGAAAFCIKPPLSYLDFSKWSPITFTVGLALIELEPS